MTIPAPFEPAPTLSLSDDMLQAAAELYPYTSDSALKAVSDLRERFSQEESARILNLVQARTKGEAKFGNYARELMLTEHGVEQASRPVIARYHAEILKAAGASVVADIGCGIGADSMGFARNGLSTVSIEMDPETASYTAQNLRFSPQSQVLVGDGTTAYNLLADGMLTNAAGEAVNALWLDPARRELGGSKGTRTERIFDPEAYSPPFSFVLKLARLGLPMGVKMGPGAPHEAIPTIEELVSERNPHPSVQTQWVQHGGDLVELVLWFNCPVDLSDSPQEGAEYSALIISGDKTDDTELEIQRLSGIPDETTAEYRNAEDIEYSLPVPGDIMYEPGAAAVRSHLVATLAEQINAEFIDPHIAYLRADSYTPTLFAKGYRVLEQIPVQDKALKKWVKAQGFTALTIKKRGVDIVPEKLRAQLLAGSKKKKEYSHATLIFTRVGQGSAAQRYGWWVEPLE